MQFQWFGDPLKKDMSLIWTKPSGCRCVSTSPDPHRKADRVYRHGAVHEAESQQITAELYALTQRLQAVREARRTLYAPPSQ